MFRRITLAALALVAAQAPSMAQEPEAPSDEAVTLDLTGLDGYFVEHRSGERGNVGYPPGEFDDYLGCAYPLGSDVCLRNIVRIWRLDTTYWPPELRRLRPDRDVLIVRELRLIDTTQHSEEASDNVCRDGPFLTPWFLAIGDDQLFREFTTGARFALDALAGVIRGETQLNGVPIEIALDRFEGVGSLSSRLQRTSFVVWEVRQGSTIGTVTVTLRSGPYELEVDLPIWRLNGYQQRSADGAIVELPIVISGPSISTHPAYDTTRPAHVGQ